MHDGFLDPISGVLLNNYGITDGHELDKVEGTKAQLRMLELLNEEVVSPRLDAASLQEIHKRLFQDVYPWAGELRGWGQYQNLKSSSADITDPGGQRTMFFGSYQSLPQHLNAIETQLAAENHLKGQDLPQFISRAAYYFDQYNYAHGFREGNGRTLAVAFTLLGEAAGYELNLVNQSTEKQYNLARDFAILRPTGEPNKDLEPLRAFFAQITQPFPEPRQQLVPVLSVPTSPFLQGVESMREVQQTQEILWRALLNRDRNLSSAIQRATRAIVHLDEELPDRLERLRAGATLLLGPVASPVEARIQMAATRLLRALPLVTLLVLGTVTLSQGRGIPRPSPTNLFTPAEIPPEVLTQMGSSVERIRASGQLDQLLRGEKTAPIAGFTLPQLPGTSAETFAAQLLLRRDADGVAKLYLTLPEKQAALLTAALHSPELPVQQGVQKGEKDLAQQQKAPEPKRRGPKL